MRIVSPLMSFPDPSMDVARLTPSAAVTAVQAAQALRTCFGLSGQLDRLPGEADDNFALRTGDGRRYVVKFAHLRADPEVVSVQVRVLRHIEATAGGLPVPRVVSAVARPCSRCRSTSSVCMVVSARCANSPKSRP